MSALDERALARGLALLDVIGEAEDELLALRGWVRRQVGGLVSWYDATGSGAPYGRSHALRIARSELEAQRVALLAGAP